MRLSLLRLYLLLQRQFKHEIGFDVGGGADVPQVSWLAAGVWRVWEHNGGVEYARSNKATGSSEPGGGRRGLEVASAGRFSWGVWGWVGMRTFYGRRQKLPATPARGRR